MWILITWVISHSFATMQTLTLIVYIRKGYLQKVLKAVAAILSYARSIFSFNLTRGLEMWSRCTSPVLLRLFETQPVNRLWDCILITSIVSPFVNWRYDRSCGMTVELAVTTSPSRTVKRGLLMLKLWELLCSCVDLGGRRLIKKPRQSLCIIISHAEIDSIIKLIFNFLHLHSHL